MNCLAAKYFIFDDLSGRAGDVGKEMSCQKPIGHEGAHFVMLPSNTPVSWKDGDKVDPYTYKVWR